ncbi:uncharacterized protein STEHIDRAFT_109021 [Stereum hirsutum FP-91666 SS1]|uniref:uncharacterized protein n=1 Tax=Stereum hirsutum (strain FP-91666) TaxID=721885 RepID=UPI00044103DF|nr:uncharacterized protein STEHIDRAFT_109021 [Stereum hirsutum FP-91666 SS1]EIM88645.1 hypothetical protein STEHIDRAFT_109021 [Stereum hirsutum FP-91666 SS1]
MTRLALVLGGPDSKNPSLPKAAFEIFSSLIAKCAYQTWQSSYANKRKKIPALIEANKNALQDAIASAGSLTTAQAVRLLNSLTDVQAMMEVFQGDKSRKTLEEGAIDEDFEIPEGCNRKKLVPALRKAVSTLARESDTARITLLTHEAILRAGGNNDDDYAEILRLSDLSPNDISDWQSGSEAYANLNTEEVKVRLRIDKKSLIGHDGVLPFMNSRYDNSEARRNPADHVEWFKDEKNGVVLTPRWHQLVAMLAMIEMAFDGKPVAVLDEVGIGKTIQTIGVIMLLTWYREFYTKKGHFPGAFSK